MTQAYALHPHLVPYLSRIIYAKINKLLSNDRSGRLRAARRTGEGEKRRAKEKKEREKGRAKKGIAGVTRGYRNVSVPDTCIISRRDVRATGEREEEEAAPPSRYRLLIYSCRYLRRPINIDVLYCTRRVARRLLSRIMTRFTARDPISVPLVPRLINRCKLNGTRLDFFARRSGETISLSATRIFRNINFSRAAICPLVPPEMTRTRLPWIPWEIPASLILASNQFQVKNYSLDVSFVRSTVRRRYSTFSDKTHSHTNEGTKPIYLDVFCSDALHRVEY